MIVTCQSCLRHYKLDESRIKPSGSKVQCSKCREIFTVYPPDTEPQVDDPTPTSVEAAPTPTTTLPPVESKIADEIVIPPEASSDEVRIELPETDDIPVTVTEPSLAFETEKDPDLADADDEPPKTFSATDDTDTKDFEIEAAPSKKGCLPIVLFLLILPAVIYGALILMDKRGVEMPWLEGLNLPYLSQSSDAKQRLPHEMITAANINSRFIRNSQGDPLFVISGKLTNQGKTPQQAVQLKGVLFDEANAVLAEKMVVGGRFLSDLDLIALSQEEIEQKLTAMDESAAMPVIDAGASVPFMVVFFNLSDGLKEFSVKVTGSEPAS